MKRYFLSLLLCCIGLNLWAQLAPKPRLVVVMMVDELSSDQLILWQKKFEKGGISRMMNQGTFIPYVSLNSVSAWQGAGVASFFTGATPSVHGLVSEKWIDRFSQKSMSALYGPIVGDKIDTTQVPDCKNMLASTLADELLRLYPNTSKVRAVGMMPSISSFATGHGKDGFYCFDEKSGLIINKSLASLPDWAREFNDKRFSETYRQREWGPLNNINDYYEARFYRSTLTPSFLYKFNTDLNYSRLIYSPYGNVMMRDFAVSMMINEGIGKDEYPDLLTISFTLKPGAKKNCAQFDAEVEDMALRLDHEVTGLIRFFEETIGIENVVMVLTSAHNPGVFPVDYTRVGTPTGTFSGRKAISLLNLYFMAQYGQGKWVMDYHDGTFIMNTALIAEKNMSLDDMRQKTADFLLQMSGVARAYTYQQLLRGSSSNVNQAILQSFHPKRSGDVIIELEPGWAEELDNGVLQVRPLQTRHIPVLFFGAGIPSKTIRRVCPIVDIAPTISTLFQMSYPNGCEGRPVDEVFNK
jgi:hypothetical protein